MTTLLSNAFSLNMLQIGTEGIHVDIQPVSPSEIPTDAKSIIGHEDMANIVSGILGYVVEVNRESAKLLEDDILFVAQYRGPRLPEGTTILPPGATLEFYRIKLIR